MLNTVVLLIPVLLLIVFIEWYISYKKQDHAYTSGNFVMNLAVGAMDQVFSLIYFTALYFALDFVYTRFRFIELEDHWYHWITAYIAVDFLSYWYHRFSHRINILWAGHVTHHSSEHFNFSNGFRTSFFQGINRIIFWSFLPLFGFSPVMLVIILKVSGLYDFLLHTTYIPKLGFLEKILITPSQHRVHHGRNDIYIDKNYGSTFVIWDKIFGTFQEETETVEYGIKGNYTDNNPFLAIGYYYRYIWRAMKITPGLHKKIALLFYPPVKTPQVKLKNVDEPTEETISPGHKNYARIQIAIAVPGMILMLLYKDFLPGWELALYSVTGILTISFSAMILNENMSGRFASREMARLALAALIMTAAFAIRPTLHELAVLIFQFASLLFFLVIQKEKDAVTSEQ